MQVHSNSHLLWLWSWFLFGALSYIVKRAYYLITGPNPVANNIFEFMKVAGVPIAFRLIVDSGFYWACFTPQALDTGLKYLGLDKAAYSVDAVTHFGVFALFFGMGVDPMIDWAIGTILGKLPFVKDIWPQMPAPLKPEERK